MRLARAIGEVVNSLFPVRRGEGRGDGRGAGGDEKQRLLNDVRGPRFQRPRVASPSPLPSPPGYGEEEVGQDPARYKFSNRCCLSNSNKASMSGSSWPCMMASRLKFFSPPPSPPRRWSVQRFWGKL